MKRLFLIVIAIISYCTATAQQSPVVLSQVLFEKGYNGYHTFRIPSIAVANDGTILAFAEGRKKGGGDSGDIDLVLRRSVDGGKTWGDMITVWDDGTNVCGNPAPIVDRASGRIVLLSTWNRGDDHEKDIHRRLSKDTRRVFMLTSDDNGLTWSTSREITQMAKKPEWTWYATGPCHGIQLLKGKNKGRMVVACDYGEYITEGKAEAASTHSMLIYSDDKGETWQIGGESGRGGNESTVAELKNGDLMLNMRGARYPDRLTRGPYRQVAVSKDGGLTLGEMYGDSALEEPVCQATIINYLNKGKLSQTLVFCNPNHESKRENLTLKISRDSGKTWTQAHCVTKGCAAYSDIAQLPSGDVAVFYEQGNKGPYEKITFDIIAASVFK